MIELFFELSLIALVLGLIVLMAVGLFAFYQWKTEQDLLELEHQKELTEKKENGNTQN